MAKKTKSAADAKKDQFISVKVTPQVKERLRMKAKIEGRSMSTLLARVAAQLAESP
jgi:uncharacterized protein (DUF1778 family)